MVLHISTPLSADAYEKEWSKHYAANSHILNNPSILSAYLADAIQKNSTIARSLRSLGINKPFLVGASSSSYQIEGGIYDENAYVAFVKRENNAIAQYVLRFLKAFQTMRPSQAPWIHQEFTKWQLFEEKLKQNNLSQEDIAWARRSWEHIRSLIQRLIKKRHYPSQLRNTDPKKIISQKIRALAGKALDFWNHFPKYTHDLKEILSVNTFRLSIEWSRIQPTKDTWDMNALARYKSLIGILRKYGIEPIVVLHHYTVPTWFDNLGGFLHEENSDYFVHFAQKVYDILAPDVTLWSTFNAIEGYAFKGYYLQEGPPGISQSMHNTQIAMTHMLSAHIRIYKALKKAYQIKRESDPSLKQPQIGLQKNILPLDPRPSWNPISMLGALFGEKAQNQAFYSFFTTGKSNISIPFNASITYPSGKSVIEEAPYCLDWIGINHYSNAYISGFTRLTETDVNRTTENPTYRFYPEGLYRAVKEISKALITPLKRVTGKTIPMIITENGIASGTNEEKRELFFKQTLFTIAQAIKDGHTIIGYTPWAAWDNHEWGEPNGMRRYGLIHIDFSNPLIGRSLKKGAQFYVECIRLLQKQLAETSK